MTPPCCVSAPSGPVLGPVSGNLTCAAAQCCRGQCTWCSSPAITYCESDKVLLCKSCDVRLHTSSLVASRHLRRIPCQACFGRGSTLRCRQCPGGYYCEPCHNGIVAKQATADCAAAAGSSSDCTDAHAGQHQTTPVGLLAPLPALPQDLTSDDPLMSDALTCADVAAAAAGGPASQGCPGEGAPENSSDGGEHRQQAAADVADGAASATAHSAGSSFAPCGSSVGCMPRPCCGTASTTEPPLPAPRVAGKWRGVGAAAAALSAAAATLAESSEEPEQPEEGERAEALETTEDGMEDEQEETEDDEDDDDTDMHDCAVAAGITADTAAAGQPEEEAFLLAPMRRPPSRTVAADSLCAACSGAVPLCEVVAAAPPCAFKQHEVETGTRPVVSFGYGCCNGSSCNCSNPAVCPRMACEACAAALPGRCRQVASSAGSDEDDEEMLCDNAAEAVEMAASLAARRVGGDNHYTSQAAGDNLVPVWGHAKAAVVAGKQLDWGAAAACACFGKWCGYVSALRDGQLTSSGHAALRRRDGTAAAEVAAAAGEAAVAVPAEMAVPADAVVSRQCSYSTSVHEQQQVPFQDQVAPAAAGGRRVPTEAVAPQQSQHLEPAPPQYQVQTQLLAVAGPPATTAAVAGMEAQGDDMFASMAGLSEQEQRRILLQQLEELRQQEQARLHAMHVHWLQQQEAMHVQMHMQAQQVQRVQQMQLACAQPTQPFQQLQQGQQQPHHQQLQVQMPHAVDMEVEGHEPGGCPASLPSMQQTALSQQPLPLQQYVHLHGLPGQPPYAVQQYQRYLAEQYQGAFPYSADASHRPEQAPQQPQLPQLPQQQPHDSQPQPAWQGVHLQMQLLPQRQQQPQQQLQLQQPQPQQTAPRRRVSETNATSPFASSSAGGAVAPATPSTPSADVVSPAPSAAAAAAVPVSPLPPAPIAAAVQPPPQRPAQPSQQGALPPRGPSLNGGIRKPVPPPVITIIRRGPDGSILQRSSPPPPPAVRRSVTGRRDDVTAPAGAAAPGAVAPKATAPAEAASNEMGAAAAPAAAQSRTTPAYAPVTTPEATAYAAQVLAAAAAAAAGTSGSSVQRELTRQERVARYLEKRKRRNFDKVIRYATRKYYAEVRPRIRGRFARREEIEAWKMAHGGPDVEVPAVLDDD